ncbi:MAG: DUF1836 domain-containing protein [Clostridia bacterium]|nr:DUF1836 domain-containing protein [Clostridia bacterium]
MICRDDIKAYRIPRWNELPDLELYMDQVISVLEKNLCIFAYGENSAFITPTMINNYVKQKLVSPPRNKRYNKGHIAAFYIITLMKQIMSISEINTAIKTVSEKMGEEKGYDLFCDTFEASLVLIFLQEENKTPDFGECEEAYMIIRSTTLAFANMLYARSLLFEYLPQKQTKKEKKEKKKQ